MLLSLFYLLIKYALQRSFVLDENSLCGVENVSMLYDCVGVLYVFRYALSLLSLSARKLLHLTNGSLSRLYIEASNRALFPHLVVRKETDRIYSFHIGLLIVQLSNMIDSLLVWVYTLVPCLSGKLIFHYD